MLSSGGDRGRAGLRNDLRNAVIALGESASYDSSKDLTLAANKILLLDPNRPIYSPGQTYVDLFVGYRTKLFSNRVRATFQLNVKNVQENGGCLLATSAFPDGTASTYRIVDPRQFILSASFDL